MTVRANNPIYIAALFYSMAGVTGCGVQGRTELGLAPASGSLGVITEQEIVSSRARTAYEAVDRVRPMYLISKVDLAPAAERSVYLNGVKLGGLRELQFIPASEVKEIRFVRAIDGGAYGVGRSAGAILVVSKSGR